MTPFLKADLERDEGLRLKPYRDSVGKLTLGVGRNLDDVGVNRDEAMAMLANDVERAVAGLDAHLPWWRSLGDERQDVLANMGFQLGVGGLLAFKDSLAAVQAGRYAQAALDMLGSTWARQCPQRAGRLVEQMRTGARAEPFRTPNR